MTNYGNFDIDFELTFVLLNVMKANYSKLLVTDSSMAMVILL